MTWEAVRDALMQYEQVLCIVNTRKDCRDLHQLMPEGSIHLSALMCAEERSHCISSIKEKLHHGEPLRVISTQLVEAGVDIDFPVVYRALAGFDSIAQAAGRCNRENKLASQGRKGHVVIFVPPRQAPPGLLRKGEDACKEILRLHEECSLTSQIYKSYFASFYAKLNDVDKPEFYDHLVLNAGDFKFQFRTLAQHFQLIDDQCYQSIVVHYHDSRSLCAMLASSCPGRWLQRKLQRYMVNVPNYWLRHFVDHDMVTSVGGYFVQKSANLYKEGVGIQLDDSTLTEQMII
jgi:CRISPR-associated endonuclease/helicase Cas3